MLKAFLARFGQDLAYSTGISPITAKLKGDMRILMLHGVGDELLSRVEFEQVLDYMQKEFEIVSLAEMVSQIESDSGAKGSEVALTFDDGLRNNVTIAYPILEARGIPATFFICPDLIDKGRWLWNHEVRARMEYLDGEELLDLLDRLEIDSDAVYGNETEPVVEAMKSLSKARRLEVEEFIAQSTAGFVPSADQKLAYDLASWDEIRALNPELITIGSHTLTHPILPSLETADLEREIVGCRARLESALDREVEFFCYPNGDNDKRSRELVARTYRAAVTTLPGTVQSEHELHCLPRIGVQRDPSTMAWRLFRP